MKKQIELTEVEASFIKNALYFVYDKKLDIVAKNNKVMTTEEKNQIIDSANKYFDLTDKF